MSQDTLETHIDIVKPDSPLRRLADDVGRLLMYNEHEVVRQFPEAEKYRAKFEDMDLKTKYAVHKELMRIAEEAAGRMDFGTARNYLERASYLWEGYIVFRRT